MRRVPPISSLYLTWPSQGHCIHFYTAFITVPHLEAVSASRCTGPEGRQRSGLASPMGPLAFPGCEVRESIRDSMMRSCALGAHYVGDMVTCLCPCASIIDFHCAGNPRLHPHFWAISPHFEDMNDNFLLLSFHNMDHLQVNRRILSTPHDGILLEVPLIQCHAKTRRQCYKATSVINQTTVGLLMGPGQHPEPAGFPSPPDRP